MGAVTIQQMADRVASLMEERLRVRGPGLDAKLKSGGRRLPRRVRGAAEQLALAAGMAQNPRLLARIDEAQVAGAYDICVRYLSRIGAWERRSAILLGAVGSVAFSLLAAGVLLALLLIWRGFL